MLSTVCIYHELCFRRSKLITSRSNPRLWTLWIADADANVKSNWVRLMDGNSDLFFIEVSASHFSTETQEFCLPKQDDLIAFESALFVVWFQNQNEWWFHLYLLLIILQIQVKKKLLVYQGPYNDKAMFLIWGYILLSPNENYLSFHCLKEIGALV